MSSCPAPPSHDAQVLFPKHLPEGGWRCLLRKSSRNQAWIWQTCFWQWFSNLTTLCSHMGDLKDLDVWAQPQRLCFNCSRWGPTWVFFKSSPGDSNVKQVWELCSKWIKQNILFSLRRQRRTLFAKGWRAGCPGGPRHHPTKCLEGPLGLSLQDRVGTLLLQRAR